jgi:hypothetical protein
MLPQERKNGEPYAAAPNCGCKTAGVTAPARWLIARRAGKRVFGALFVKAAPEYAGKVIALERDMIKRARPKYCLNDAARLFLARDGGDSKRNGGKLGGSAESQKVYAGSNSEKCKCGPAAAQSEDNTAAPPMRMRFSMQARMQSSMTSRRA